MPRPAILTRDNLESALTAAVLAATLTIFIKACGG